MADIDDVRVIIADPPSYDRSQDIGDGLVTEFLIPNAPIVLDSERVYFDGVLVPNTEYTLDLNTGRLVFNTAPGSAIVILVTYNWVLLSDTSLTTFLTLWPSDIRLAAAAALDTIASSEALVQKKIEHLDLKTDGPAVARALREHAKTLRQQAAEEEELTGDQEGMIDYAEMGIPVFARSDLFWKTWSSEN